MRSSSFGALVVLGACSFLPAQGVVNATLLAPSADETRSPLRTAAQAGVVQKARAGVVFVAIEIDGPRGKFLIERASTGVVADARGFVVTWLSLVKEAVGEADKRLLVQLDDAANTRLPAKLVRSDAATGLALLQVDPPAGGLAAVAFGPDRIAAGEPVVVVGRPEGKEMLAFAGVASPALGPVALGGVTLAAQDLFLCDSRNDERCNGAGVFDHQGRLRGLYASEHVQRDKSEPTLEELKQPSFGIALPVGRLHAAFAKELAGGSNQALPAAGEVHPYAAAVAAVAPSVVSVWCGDGDWPVVGALDPGAVVRREGLGSGVVLSASGLVVGNAHVVKSGTPRVRLLDGRTFPAKVVKKQGGSNLALLQVELPAGATLPAASCGVDDDVVLGEPVLAVGNPLGTACVVTGGVVSAKRDREGGRIQADANLGNQNGGGAIVDASGRLLGIGDAGEIDPIDMAFAQRGERATTETNLSTFVGIARVRRAFQKELAAVGADESIRAPQPATDAQRRLRSTPLTAMVEKTSGALLNIYVAKNAAVQKEDDPFPPEPQWVTMSLGSGVIVDPSGLAISNWHVVDDATRPDGSMVADHRVTARVFGGKEYVVKVLSISREDDLSLLQLELEAGETVKSVELGDSDAVAIGEPVAAIGNPHGRANTITAGVVTAKEQKLKVKGRHRDLEPVLETDAAINGGNSGGALLDMHGRLVGINSAGGGTFNNKGYAIEVNYVRAQVLGLLFAAYKLRSADLGMRVMDADGAVSVFDVDARGPAAKAGVQSGDRIVTLAGVPITWSPGFARTLLAQAAGVELELVVLRKGERLSVKCTPLPAEVWSVVKQSGLLVRDLSYAEAPERVRAAAIALHRQFTGDAKGEPASIAAQVVAIERVYGGEQPDGVDLAAGDLLLAVELVDQERRPVLKSLASVAALRDLWNDRELGKYAEEGGQRWKCWVERGGVVRDVQIKASRLYW